MSTPGTQLKSATIAHYEAKKAEAEAVLAVYYTNPVGIGEHSDLLEETTKWVEILANAIDCLEAIKTI